MNPYKAPSVEVGDHSDSDGSFVRSALAGRFRLWRVFWLLFVPAPFVIYAISMLAFWVDAQSGRMAGFSFLVISIVLVTLFCMSFLGLVVSRCAANSNYRVFGYLARLAVVAYLIWYGNKAVGTLAMFYFF